jgi:2-octaprenyl-6-methoxyphenol hydroxylase
MKEACMAQSQEAQIAVVGAGPGGLATALALSALGAEVVVAGPPYEPGRARADRRTTALLRGSVEFLRNLGAWDQCADQSAPLEAIRVVDDRGGLLRAPEVLFRAEEVGLASFGANLPNAVLTAALDAAARRQRTIAFVDTAAVTKVEISETGVRLQLAEGGCMSARLAVAADGRHSLVRKAAGIATRTWDHGQAAIAASFVHTRPHNGITTELHRQSGPLTTVPLPGSASSLVWVEAAHEAGRIAGLDDDAFLAALEERLHGLLGSLRDATPRAVHPLTGLHAGRMGQDRVALIGEAGHVLPPIGAQGLNLGLRDAAALAECVADARSRGEDVGGTATLEAYHRARAADVLSRTVSVELLNRSLLLDFLPVQALRGLGLHLLANVAPLRRLAMRGGLEPAGALPRLMRPGGLS